MDNLFQELYKRFIVPLYIPILILTSLFLIIFSKENKLYQKTKIIIFGSGIFFIILSESLLRFVTDNFLLNIKILFFPIVIFIILYFLLIICVKKNLGAKT